MLRRSAHRGETYSLLDLVEENVRAAMRSVASDHVDLIDFVAKTPFDDLVCIKSATRGLEECSTLVVDFIDQFGG